MAETEHIERDGFYFLANQLALDLVNTRPLLEGELTELLPDFDALVRWFAAAGIITTAQAGFLRRRWSRSEEGRQAVGAMVRLRERLREDVLEWIRSGNVRSVTIDRLNQLLAVHPTRTKLSASGKGFRTEREFIAEYPADLFGPIAQSAAELFAHVDRKRVRKCGHCVGIFHDTSKKGTRRWCSMQLCGNRVKVAAYAARQRG
jgi:predicted RNA-binding Zn ribbon-like protein